MRILFIDFSTKLETIHDLTKRARGGMVSSLFKVSDYLAWRGHDVTVLSDVECDGVTAYGTKWLKEAWGKYDCLITNRGTHDGYPQIDAQSRILWTHDLPHSGFIPEPKTIKGYACTVFMSRYAEDVWRTFYRDIGKSVCIPNGVTPELFKPREKEPVLIFASAPNRGLHKLPFILECVRNRVSTDVELHAYSNLQVLHPNEKKQKEEDNPYTYPDIDGDNVKLMDPIPQREFAYKLGSAAGLVMPSAYPEICSNVVLQALSCGTPVFTTGGLGFIDEWVKHGKNGALTNFQPQDYMVYTVEMVRNLVRYLEDARLQKRMQRTAARARVWSWKRVGRAWERMLKSVSR
jgi:glycosyltransferase involved in cell wall biosynthesis